MTDHRKVYYYHSFNDDFITSNQQDFKLPANYKWMHNSKIYAAGARFLDWVIKIIALIYCRCIMRIKFVNTSLLKNNTDHGYFIYANHTQPQADAFIPFQLNLFKSTSIIVSPANLGIPIIGRLLPMAGATPIPSNLHQMKDFISAINYQIADKKQVVIYPEAHVWPYYTDIRPLPLSAFHYPVNQHSSSYCMTTTYQRPKRSGGRPQITIYLDGPFKPKQALSPKQQQIDLRNQIFNQMKKRSSYSNYQAIQYERR